MADDDVQLTDLEVIQQFSLAVRGATASRLEVIAALEADLAYLTGGARRRAAATVQAAAPPARSAPRSRPAPAAKPTPKPAARAIAPKPAAKKTAVKKAAKAPAKRAPVTKAGRSRRA